MIIKKGWPIFLVFTISLAFVFVVGFITSINISKSSDVVAIEPTIEKENIIKDSKLEDTEELSLHTMDIDKILIMGDSIGFGIGDEPNMGIGNRYKSLLDPNESRDIEIVNISVPGYESIDLLSQIEKQENLDNILGTDIIIISIGGNDLNRLGDNDDISFEMEYADKLELYKKNLQSIIDRIRQASQNVHLAIIGLYDPYRLQEPQNTRYLLEWNYQTRLIVNSYSNIAYIPLYEKFEYHLDVYLSEDEFHPSKYGYGLIAEELYDILNGTIEND